MQVKGHGQGFQVDAMNATSNESQSKTSIRRASLPLIAVLTVIPGLFAFHSGHAMTCIAPYPDLDAALAAEDHVFVARLVQAEFTHRRTVVQGTFEVLDVIKGARDINRVSFEAMVDRGEGCGLDVVLNARYIVFLTAPRGYVNIGPNTVRLDGNASAQLWVSRMLKNNEDRK